MVAEATSAIAEATRAVAVLLTLIEVKKVAEEGGLGEKVAEGRGGGMVERRVVGG